jgi:putative flippase GtrA
MLCRMLTRLVKHKTDRTFVQLGRYALVGAVAFAADFGTLYVLTDFLHVYYLRSAALAFVLGLTTNYLLSVMWVFPTRTFRNRFFEYGIFGLLGVLGLGLNEILIYSLTEHARWHYLFSKVVATALVFLWNFGSRKVILFQYAPPLEGSPVQASRGNPTELTGVLPGAVVGRPIVTTQLFEKTI